jgi:hypothetical protein
LESHIEHRWRCSYEALGENKEACGQAWKSKWRYYDQLGGWNTHLMKGRGLAYFIQNYNNNSAVLP